MKTERPIRILLAKAGLDGHNRGVQLVAQGLRNAGMEVIFGGLRVSPEQVVQTALEEDVDVIGLSVFSGGLMTIVPKILRAIQASEVASVPVIVGGILPPADAAALKEMGVREVFGPGSDLDHIASCVEKLARRGSD